MSEFDLILRNAHIVGSDTCCDIAIRDGRIVTIEPSIAAAEPGTDLRGRLVLPGFCDSHVHLDKACLMERCGHDEGDLGAAIAAVSRLKADFTSEDVYARGARVLEKAIVQGTTHMRTHVEIDPVVGLRGFSAIKALRDDYRWAIDLAICVFPQEGMTNNLGTEDILVAALEDGADLLGGCPYTDSDPDQQIMRLFDLAERFDVDLDFHLDFDLDPTWMHLDAVLRETDARKRGGRVAIGHVTKLSALRPDRFAAIADRLANAGIAVTVLPSTDLYLTGREHGHDVPRGVTPAHRLASAGVCCSIATNNVMNPFTPFGDCSLMRMANLYANVCHAGPSDFASVLDLVTGSAARLMNLRDYGLRPGAPADMVVLDAQNPVSALGEIAQPLFGLKRGRRTFVRPEPYLERTDGTVRHLRRA